MRTRFCSLVTAASVLVLGLAGTAGAATAPTGPPTAVGTGGAAATVETLATRAAVDTLRRGGNAVDAAVTAAAVLGVTEPFSCGIGGGGFLLLRTAGGAVTTVDHRETAPAAMAPDSFWEAGAPLAFNAARYSGLSVGVPGTVAGWADALDRYGTISLAEALAPAIRIARRGLRDRPGLLRPDAGERRLVRRHPRLRGPLPRPRRDAEGRRHGVPQPRSRPSLRADRPPRREGLLPRRDRRRAHRDGAAPARRPHREPRVAERADDDARPAPVRGARARADARRLPRARRLGHGAAVERRLDRRRGAEHPRGLPARDADAGAAAAPVPRGLAVLVRRPRRVPRRPGLRRRAAAAGSSPTASPPRGGR